MIINDPYYFERNHNSTAQDKTVITLFIVASITSTALLTLLFILS